MDDLEHDKGHLEGEGGGSDRDGKPGSEASALPERKLSLEELQTRVAEEVAHFYEGDNGQRIRNLCRMAVQWNVDARRFRALLIKLGLQPSRASEIKSVLMCEPQCRRFLNGGSWKEALKNSRLQGNKDLRRTAVRLLRLLARYPAALAGKKVGCWQIEHDNLGQVRFTHPENGTLEVLTVIRTYPFPS